MCGLPRGLGAAGDPATGAGRESGARGQRRGPAGRFHSRGICDEATAHVLEQQTRVLPAGRGPPTPHGVAGVRAGRGRCGLRGATCARTPRGRGAPHPFAANRPPSSRLCALTRARAAWETPPRSSSHDPAGRGRRRPRGPEPEAALPEAAGLRAASGRRAREPRATRARTREGGGGGGVEERRGAGTGDDGGGAGPGTRGDEGGAGADGAGRRRTAAPPPENTPVAPSLTDSHTPTSLGLESPPGLRSVNAPGSVGSPSRRLGTPAGPRAHYSPQCAPRGARVHAEGSRGCPGGAWTKQPRMFCAALRPHTGVAFRETHRRTG